MKQDYQNLQLKSRRAVNIQMLCWKMPTDPIQRMKTCLSLFKMTVCVEAKINILALFTRPCIAPNLILFKFLHGKQKNVLAVLHSLGWRYVL